MFFQLCILTEQDKFSYPSGETSKILAASIQILEITGQILSFPDKQSFNFDVTIPNSKSSEEITPFNSFLLQFSLLRSKSVLELKMKHELSMVDMAVDDS